MSLLHCKKYQYGVFLLPRLLRGFIGSISSSSSSRYCRAWRYGLLFLNNLLEAMSAEKAPKFSQSGGSVSDGTETGPVVSVPPLDAGDWDTDLVLSPLCRCQGVDVSTLDGRCRDKSCTPVRFRVVAELLPVPSRDNLATDTEKLLPCRMHEVAADVNILKYFITLNVT